MEQNNQTDKIQCSVCGATIKNARKNILAHEKTKKHQDAVEGKDKNQPSSSRDAVARFRARKRQELGEIEFKKQQREEQAKRRAGKRAVQEPVAEEVKDYQQGVRKDVKEVISQLNNVLTKKRDAPENQLEEVKQIEEKVQDVLPRIELNADCLAIVDKMFEAGKKYAERQGDMNAKIDGKKVYVSKNSIVKYHKTMHRFYERFYGKELIDCSDMSWIKKDLNAFSSFVMGYVKDNARDPKNYQNSLTSIINDIVSYLKRLKGYEHEYKFLSKLLKVNVARREEILQKNQPTDQQKQRLIPLDELKNYSSKADEQDPVPRLLFYLYTFFPRRLQDYRVMKVIKFTKKINTISRLQKDHKKYDSNSNYVVIRNEKPFKFIFNTYKESVKEILGQQIFEIPEPIKKVITDYINQQDIKEGELLFSNTSGQEISTNNFSKAISESFKKITGIPISVNDSRHIKATYYASQGLSISDLNKIANEMAQSSWGTLYSYMKVGLTNDDVAE